MARGHQTWAYYAAFGAFVTAALALAPPEADPFPFDYATMSSGYGGLLAGLGGFAITVLAVMLGLEALDSQRASRAHVAAHGVVLRHVSLSLAVASIICFIGAQILSEVNAQSTSITAARNDASEEIGLHLEALGVAQSEQARYRLMLRDRGTAFFEPDGKVSRLVDELAAAGVSTSALIPLRERAQTLDMLFGASTRRHLMIASVVALLSSLLILKSITFLLVVRFPSFPSIGSVQDFAVLGFGGMLLIKVLQMASYGLPPSQIVASRWLVPVVLAVVIVAYRAVLARQVATLRSSVVQGEMGRYTPAAPYLLSLLVCFVTMVYLAATFGNLGAPSTLDRLMVALSALLGSAMIVTIQIERPTLNLFVEAERGE